MPVVAKLHEDNKLSIFFTQFYPRDYIERINSIQNCEWNKLNKTWNIPLSMDNLQILEDMFAGDKLIYDANVHRFINKNKKKEIPVVEFNREVMSKELKFRGYSSKTIKAYTGHMDRLANRFSNGLSTIEVKDIKN